MAVLFFRFRYHQRWWQVDVVAALTFVIAAVAVGIPAVGLTESLITGLLFAAFFEASMLAAWGLRGWVRRRVFED